MSIKKPNKRNIGEMDTADIAVRQRDELIEMIQFTEKVSAKIHGVLNEDRILNMVTDTYRGSKKYDVTIGILSDGGTLGAKAVSNVSPVVLRKAERLTGIRLQDLDLSRCEYFRKVLREKTTLAADSMEIVKQVLPGIKGKLLSKLMRIVNYEKKTSILGPLIKQGKVVGVLAMDSPDLAEYFIPSVEMLCKHISSALELAQEYTQRNRAEAETKQMKDALTASQKKLKEKNIVLNKKNIVLRELLDQMKTQKDGMERQVRNNVDKLILPLLAKVRGKVPEPDRKYLDLLNENLQKITADFGGRLSDGLLALTPRELEISNMIKNGLTSKEIGRFYNLSTRTIEVHRLNIRKKLGLLKNKQNLVTFLNL